MTLKPAVIKMTFVKWQPDWQKFGNVIFVQKVVVGLEALLFICVDIQRKFLLNAIFARKNTLIKTPWLTIFNSIRMKKHSSVHNAKKISKVIVTLKVTWSLIPTKNAIFVIVAVMDHILDRVLIDMSWNAIIILWDNVPDIVNLHEILLATF